MDAAEPDGVSSRPSNADDADAGRSPVTVSPTEADRRPRLQRRPLPLAAAVLLIVAICAVVVMVVGANQDDRPGIATTPTDAIPTDATATDAPGPDGPVDAPTPSGATAEQFEEFVGVRMNGVGNGAIGNDFPWFVVEAASGESGRVSFTGDDGCNAYSAHGLIDADGRFEFVDGEIEAQECPGGFFIRDGDVITARDDGIDIERDGIVYPFGPGPVSVDIATLTDGRRFLDVSRDRAFPASISFDGTDVSGFDGCDTFTATADYAEVTVLLIDVESQCTSDSSSRGRAELADGDVVEHLGSNTIAVRRDGGTVLDSLVSLEENFVPPTIEWLVGDWLVGSGRVTFDEDRVIVGRCETGWRRTGDDVLIDELGECVTGLFPGDPAAEATLGGLFSRPLVHRLLQPTVDVENAAVLDTGTGAVRMLRIDDLPPSDPNRLFVLESIDGEPFTGARIPTISGSGRFVQVHDGCIELGVESAPADDGTDTLRVDAIDPVAECSTGATDEQRFAPDAGSTITTDDTGATVIDSAGRNARYVDTNVLDEALVADLLDPVTGTASWEIDGLAVEVAGPPGVGVMSIGSCERPWRYVTDDPEGLAFGPLFVDGDEPLVLGGCAGPAPTHDAVGLIELLGRTANGDGAEVRLADDRRSISIIWYLEVVRIDL